MLPEHKLMGLACLAEDLGEQGDVDHWQRLRAEVRYEARHTTGVAWPPPAPKNHPTPTGSGEPAHQGHNRKDSA